MKLRSKFYKFLADNKFYWMFPAVLVLILMATVLYMENPEIFSFDYADF